MLEQGPDMRKCRPLASRKVPPPHHHQLLLLFTKSAAPVEFPSPPLSGPWVGAGSRVKNFRSLELELEPEI